MGKQINGEPIQDAAESMSDLTSETSSAVSVAGQLAAAMGRVSEKRRKNRQIFWNRKGDFKKSWHDRRSGY